MDLQEEHRHPPKQEAAGSGIPDGVSEPEDKNGRQARPPGQEPVAEASRQELLEKEQKRRKKLIDISRETFSLEDRSSSGGREQGPPGRMFFAIPLMILFWFIYWHFYLGK